MLNTKDDEVDAIMEYLERFQLELDRKGEVFDRKGNELDMKQKDLERRENDVESKEREFVEKENDLRAKQKMLRESILDLELKFVSILEPPEQFDAEQNEDNRTRTAEQELESRKRSRRSAFASHRILDADEADGRNPYKRSCIDDKDAEQVANHDLSESGAGSIELNRVNGAPSTTQQNVVLDVSRPNSDSRDNLDTNPSSNLGALANDIGNEILENQFNVGETWACFDAEDHMPRSYVQITNIDNKQGNLSLHVACLKPFPWLPGEEKWINAGLPAGCGTFTRLETRVESPDIFSHQVHCIGNEGYGYCILPKEGETWAIYKGWDIITWGYYPIFHRQCKYELVEILSYQWDKLSFIIKVVYLVKLEGHVKPYWQRSQNDNDSFQIRTKDLFRFSHKVTSARMNSTGADGFQDGTFEIEPKFLPPGL